MQRASNEVMIARILSTTLLLAALGAMLGFAAVEAEGTQCSGVDIDVKDEARWSAFSMPIASKPTRHHRLEGELIADVDLQLMVSHLTDMDACADAEVYPTMNGTVAHRRVATSSRRCACTSTDTGLLPRRRRGGVWCWTRTSPRTFL